MKVYGRKQSGGVRNNRNQREINTVLVRQTEITVKSLRWYQDMYKIINMYRTYKMYIKTAHARHLSHITSTQMKTVPASLWLTGVSILNSSDKDGEILFLESSSDDLSSG